MELLALVFDDLPVAMIVLIGIAVVAVFIGLGIAVGMNRVVRGRNRADRP
jgi:hypothetical protein